MVNGFPVGLCGEPALPITHHHLVKRVDPKLLAQVGLIVLAVDTVPALPVEYWNHMVPFFQVNDSLPNALNNPTMLQLKRTN